MKNTAYLNPGVDLGLRGSRSQLQLIFAVGISINLGPGCLIMHVSEYFLLQKVLTYCTLSIF